MAEQGEKQHEFVAGSTGPDGGCSASCRCGTTFAGFDTVGEARALVEDHIEHERLLVEVPAFGEGQALVADNASAAWETWAEALDALIETMPGRPLVEFLDECGDRAHVEVGVGHIKWAEMATSLRVVRGHADAIAAAYERAGRKSSAGTRKSLQRLRGDVEEGGCGG